MSTASIFSPLQTSSKYQRKSSIFFGWDNQDAERHLKRSGLDSVKIGADYLGYTGIKNLNFPTDPMLPLEQYPDITDQLIQLRGEFLDKLQKTRSKLRLVEHAKIFRYLLQNGPTAAALDLKFHPDYPGRDKAGQVQYAKYKGKVVSANFVGNNLYGQLLTALGYPLWFSLWTARVYSAGVLEIFRGKLPTKGNLKFRDPGEDQRAIRSGYDDYMKNNPWLHAVDSKEPYPSVVQQRLWNAHHSKNSSSIFLRIKAAILRWFGRLQLFFTNLATPQKRVDFPTDQ
jgi:hypothetical protein